MYTVHGGTKNSENETKYVLQNYKTPGCNWCDHKDRAFTESSSPWHSAPPQTGTRGLRL